MAAGNVKKAFFGIPVVVKAVNDLKIEFMSDLTTGKKSTKKQKNGPKSAEKVAVVTTVLDADTEQILDLKWNLVS